MAARREFNRKNVLKALQERIDETKDRIECLGSAMEMGYREKLEFQITAWEMSINDIRELA